jgi:hypothetical protein
MGDTPEAGLTGLYGVADPLQNLPVLPQAGASETSNPGTEASQRRRLCHSGSPWHDAKSLIRN